MVETVSRADREYESFRLNSHTRIILRLNSHNHLACQFYSLSSEHRSGTGPSEEYVVVPRVSD